MPKIRIYESDNTGSNASDLATVFIPGSIKLKSGLADANGCVYIPSGTVDLSNYFEDSDYNTRYEEAGTTYSFIDVLHMIDILTQKGFGIIYKYMETADDGSAAAGKTTTHYIALHSNTFTESNFELLLANHTFYTRSTTKSGRYTYKAVSSKTTYEECLATYSEGEYYYIVAVTVSSALADTDWSFLLDKNSYDVKFITTGTFGTVPVAKIDDVYQTSSTYYLQIRSGLDASNFDEVNASTPLYTIAEATSSTDRQFVAATEWSSSATYYIKSVTTLTEDSVSEGGTSEQGTQVYTFDFSVANKILLVCGERKDCSLLVDLNYYDILNGVWDDGGTVDNTSDEGRITYNVNVINGIDINGNELAGDWKTALEYDDGDTTTTLTKRTVDINEGTIDLSSRAYSLVSNATMPYTYNDVSYTLTVPSSFVYLYEYADVNNVSRSWKPLSGVQRTVIGDTFTPDLSITKYYLDNSIITDGAGVSFNGIVNIRPYGYTIWGDRTLIEQTASKGVQATSYFSLRNLISDVAKEAYEAAIVNTYETNNDITWLNFKNPITQLLDSMVSAGVLTDFKIKRRGTEERNKIVCVLTLFVNLPVENFDLFINLENAEVTVSGE